MLDHDTPPTADSLKLLRIDEQEVEIEEFKSKPLLNYDADNDPDRPDGVVHTTVTTDKIEFNGETKIITRKTYELANGTTKEVKVINDVVPAS